MLSLRMTFNVRLREKGERKYVIIPKTSIAYFIQWHVKHLENLESFNFILYAILDPYILAIAVS